MICRRRKLFGRTSNPMNVCCQQNNCSASISKLINKFLFWCKRSHRKILQSHGFDSLVGLCYSIKCMVRWMNASWMTFKKLLSMSHIVAQCTDIGTYIKKNKVQTKWNKTINSSMRMNVIIFERKLHWVVPFGVDAIVYL